MRSRMLCAIAFLVLSGCIEHTPETPPTPTNDHTPPPVTEASIPFHTRLLEIASEYETYGRADRRIHWAPYMCRLVKHAEAPTPLQVSSSVDSQTHGHKLYFLFAKYVWPSNLPPVEDNLSLDPRGSYANFPGESSPVGQAIVKQSWIPEDITERTSDVEESNFLQKPSRTAHRNGRTYRATKQGELFIMFKTAPGTSGTDEGWVYGVVSTDAKTVQSAGRIESCMKCHVEASRDRLFGLPEEKPTNQK